MYKGLPYEIDDEIYLPAPAVEILKAQGSLSAEQIAYVDAHTVDLGQTPAEPEAVPAEAEAETTAQPAETEEHIPEAGQVVGKTTFYDLLEWGLTQDAIEEILGSPMPATGTLVKDHVSSLGLSFSEVRAQLQEALDAVAK